MKTRFSLFALVALLTLLLTIPASAQIFAPLAPAAELLNGDFSAYNFGWTQETTATAPNGIICNAAMCGENIFYRTYSDDPEDFAVRMGGNLAPQSDIVSQRMVFPRQGRATLFFYLWPTFVNADANATLRVMVDNITVSTIPINSTTPEYTIYSIEMLPYLNGQVRNLSFRFDKGEGFVFLNLDQIGFYFGSSYNWVNFDGYDTEWNIKRATNDRVVCNTEIRIVSYNGPCAMEFRGSANERSQFRSILTVPAPTLVEMPQRDLVRYTAFAGAFFKTKGAVPNATLTLTITLTDGRTFTKSRAIPVTYGQYVWVQTPLVKLPPQFDLISSYTVRIDNRSTTGRFWVDGVRSTINGVWE
ncbi:MAG: hypothetical protein MUF38_13755 [Anaerolineae bacterium]|jgi:hypothetical protein|nr:hypothetical protein [Anaerolineae bacterium]